MSKLKQQTILKLFLFTLLAAILACEPEHKPCNVVVSVLAVNTSIYTAHIPEVVWQTTSYDTTLIAELNDYGDWKKARDNYCNAGTIVELVYSDSSQLKFEASINCGKPFAHYFGQREDETRYIPSGAALDRLREWYKMIELKVGWVFF